jgi:type II secretory pathway pseudopilin PulG
MPASNLKCRHEMQAGAPVRAGRQPEFHRARGFTYFGLLVLVAIMGIVLAAAGEIWHTAQKQEKERELLFVGNQFRLALNQFYRHTPGQASRYPLRLEELLADPRYPGIQRYLRKIYVDPMTGRTEWGLLTGPSGEILAVHSLSEDAPLKKGNFRPEDKNFEGKTKYSEWVFLSTAR